MKKMFVCVVVVVLFGLVGCSEQLDAAELLDAAVATVNTGTRVIEFEMAITDGGVQVEEVSVVIRYESSTRFEFVIEGRSTHFVRDGYVYARLEEQGVADYFREDQSGAFVFLEQITEALNDVLVLDARHADWSGELHAEQMDDGYQLICDCADADALAVLVDLDLAFMVGGDDAAGEMEVSRVIDLNEAREFVSHRQEVLLVNQELDLEITLTATLTYDEAALEFPEWLDALDAEIQELDGALEVVESEYVQALLDAGGTVFLYVGRPTCPFCREFQPILAQTLIDRGESIYYFEIDLAREANAGLTDEVLSQLGISGVPALLYLEDGVVVDQLTGVRTPEELNVFFDR